MDALTQVYVGLALLIFSIPIIVIISQRKALFKKPNDTTDKELK